MVRRRQRPEKEKGASLAEFALVAPLLVVLMFGLVEFGLAVYTKETLNNASREGARFGVVYSQPRKTTSDITARVQDFLTQSGFTAAAAVNVTGAGGASGSQLMVTVTYPYNFIVLPQFVSGLLGTITLTSSTVMLME